MANNNHPNHIQGRAPYNPYDPTENRPLGGYPSEFAIPGKKTNSGVITPANEFERVRTAMNRLGYHPRPRSSIYPGQYKLLRRIDDSRSRFWQGAKYITGAVVIGGSLYITFFHRWNDGYDNMFSEFYRFQLKMKWWAKGTLSKEEFDDLTPKQRGYISNSGHGHGNGSFQKDDKLIVHHETKYSLERPTEGQQIIAEEISSEREERYLKALDMAEKILKESPDEVKEEEKPKKKSGWW